LLVTNTVAAACFSDSENLSEMDFFDAHRTVLDIMTFCKNVAVHVQKKKKKKKKKNKFFEKKKKRQKKKIF